MRPDRYNVTTLKYFALTVYGGIKFAMAFRQMDQQGEHQAVYSVVAGGHEIGKSMLQFLKTFFGFCISGAMMVVIIKTGCTLCTDLVSAGLSGGSDIENCIMMTVQASITPIVIAGLVRGTDSIIARML